MSTKCYAMVRGSSLRVTALTRTGRLTSLITYAVSKSVTNVTVDTILDGGSNEILRTGDDQPRVEISVPQDIMGFTVDIDFIRVDPSILSLVTGIPVVFNSTGDIIGVDSQARVKAPAFALEVWSRIAGNPCVAGGRQYGYTLFPFLRGGVMSGFTFSDGLISFNLRGARTRVGSKWERGPYGVSMDKVVSRNTSFINQITSSAPPTQTDGSVTFYDGIDGGSASFTSVDVVDGQTVTTSADSVEGGTAS